MDVKWLIGQFNELFDMFAIKDYKADNSAFKTKIGGFLV